VQEWFDATNAKASGPEIDVLVNRNRCIVLRSIDGNFYNANELSLSEAGAAISSREVMQEILNEQEELPASLKKETAILLAGVKEYVSEIASLLRKNTGDFTGGGVTVVANPEITGYEDGQYEHDSEGYSCEAVVAAGLLELAANSKLLHFNLLPQQYVKRRQRKTLLVNYLVTGFMSLLLVLLSWLCLVGMNRRIDRMSREIESQIAPIEHIASSVESKRQRVKALRKQLSNRGQIAQIIDELYRYTPKAISISELKFVSRYDKASVEIKGQADLLANAFRYTDAMNKADLLDKIQIINAQQIPRPGGSVVEFKAHCDIKND